MKSYSTSDLRLAALLKLKGFNLVRIESGQNGRGVFVFEDKANREELVMSFLNRKELLEPIGYTEEMRNLKAGLLGR